IADTSYNMVKPIMDIYSEQENIKIQSAAILALGQIPCQSSLDFLRKIEDTEAKKYFYQRTEIYLSILNALGKIGDESDLEKIGRLELSSDSLNGTIALSIARFGMRKIKNTDAFDKLRKLTSSINDPGQLKWVAYAFNRAGDKTMLQNYKKELEQLSGSIDAFCRMWAISALGKTGDAEY